MKIAAETLAKNLATFVAKTGLKKGVVGLSGGIDSALVAKLGVMALGAENVTALILPYEGLTDRNNVNDAVQWARSLGIAYEIIAINPWVDGTQNLPWEESKLAGMNVKARVRALILYHYANSKDAIVLGTGNKTEETLGYFTKYGDGAVDCLPIGSLYKTDVWEMSRALGLPKAIIEKTPSAELSAGQTDEGEIGISYAEIDEILKRFESGAKPETDAEKKLMARIDANRHKSQVPPVIPNN
jgi:NAD+ synthase